jgi:hypothetical protein
MEQSDEILRLLAEIRDIHREQLAEYRRATEEFMRTNEEAIQTNNEANERGIAQYGASLEAAKATTWGIFILIAVCVAANLFMLRQMAGVLRHVAGAR